MSIVSIDHVDVYIARSQPAPSSTRQLGLNRHKGSAEENESEPLLIAHCRLPESAMKNGSLMSFGSNLPWARQWNRKHLGADRKQELNAVVSSPVH